MTDLIYSFFKFCALVIISFIVLMVVAMFLFYKWWTAGAMKIAHDYGIAAADTPESYVYGGTVVATVLSMSVVYTTANKLYDLSMGQNTIYIWFGIFCWFGLVLAPIIYLFST